MPDYDAIVVGAGLAGSTTAYCLAKAGLSVLVLERGDTPGSKNLTGGRLYAHSLEKVIPGFAERAPIQRTVTRLQHRLPVQAVRRTPGFGGLHRPARGLRRLAGRRG